MESHDEGLKRPMTVSEYAYARIKEMVVTGELKPGSHIDQEDLGNTLEISRTPIRAALDRLEGERLVVRAPHRGVRISPLSGDEMREIIEFRATVETMVCRIAFPKLNPRDIRVLRERNAQLAIACDAGDIKDALTANRGFHMYIYNAARRPLVLASIENFWDMSERYFYHTARRSGQLLVVWEEHDQVVNHVEAGEFEIAVEVMRTHIWSTARIIEKLNAEYPRDLETAPANTREV